MAFLDNSGDIILDAVLTDLGRMKMAEGNFSINKFALADDEIDYTLFDINHVSGSAYHDLKIMQTPVLEAFTNNTSVIKSNLMTIEGTVLYLPVLKINTKSGTTAGGSFLNATTAGGDLFLVVYDESTRKSLDGTDLAAGGSAATNFEVIGGDQKNYLNGAIPGSGQGHICVDQGIDNPDISPFRISFLTTGDMNLVESDFMIEIDSRLGKITDMLGNVLPAGPSDDDNMSAYLLNSTVAGLAASSFVSIDPSTNVFPTNTPIQGPAGNRIRFKIDCTGTELQGNDSLLDRLGNVLTSTVSTTMFGSDISSGDTTKFVDSMVRVRGMTTGYSLDIPVRFLKITG